MLGRASTQGQLGHMDAPHDDDLVYPEPMLPHEEDELLAEALRDDRDVAARGGVVEGRLKGNGAQAEDEDEDEDEDDEEEGTEQIIVPRDPPPAEEDVVGAVYDDDGTLSSSSSVSSSSSSSAGKRFSLPEAPGFISKVESLMSAASGSTPSKKSSHYMTIATELFIQELVQAAAKQAGREGKKEIGHAQIASLVRRQPFGFLRVMFPDTQTTLI